MRKLFCLFCAHVLAWSASAQADYVFAGPTEENGPFVPGGVVGAIYRFQTVAPGMDALVTITNIQGGATLTAIDNSFAYPEAFNPMVVVPAHSNGYIDFQICFVNHLGNVPITLPNLSATALDVDGFDTHGDGMIKEYDVINMGLGGSASFMNGSVDLAVTGDLNGFMGVNTNGVDFAGIDIANLNLMFTVTNVNVSCLTYRAGANNQTSGQLGRLKSLYFKSFTYPNQYVLATHVLNFGATVLKDQVLLRWEVQEDRPAITYWIKRWEDCRVATYIGSKAGNNQNTNVNTYQFLDVAPLAGRSCYSIEWINEAGKRISTDLAPVTLKTINHQQPAITTDPYSNKSSLTWFADNTGRDCDIKVYLSNGEQIKQLHYKEMPGMNKVLLTESGSMQPGMYVIVFAPKGTPYTAYKLLVRPN